MFKISFASRLGHVESSLMVHNINQSTSFDTRRVFTEWNFRTGLNKNSIETNNFGE